MSDYGFQIDVPVRNEWSNVKLLVLSVQNCFNAMFANVDGAEAVAMVTGELLENAIKYGTWTKPGQRLRLLVTGTREETRVTVENPIELDRFADLQRTLEWMQGYSDPDAAFRARLLAIAQTADPEVSKLGIVRIAYEGHCDVKAELADGIVRVTAALRMDR